MMTKSDIKQTLKNKLKDCNKESKTNPDALDKQIVLSIMPYSTNASDLIRCGIYGAASVINDKDRIIITNYYK